MQYCQLNVDFSVAIVKLLIDFACDISNVSWSRVTLLLKIKKGTVYPTKIAFQASEDQKKYLA